MTTTNEDKGPAIIYLVRAMQHANKAQTELTQAITELDKIARHPVLSETDRTRIQSMIQAHQLGIALIKDARETQLRISTDE